MQKKRKGTISTRFRVAAISDRRGRRKRNREGEGQQRTTQIGFELWSNSGVFVLGTVVSKMFIISFKMDKRPVMIVGPKRRIMVHLVLKSSLQQKRIEFFPSKCS